MRERQGRKATLSPHTVRAKGRENSARQHGNPRSGSADTSSPALVSSLECAGHRAKLSSLTFTPTPTEPPVPWFFHITPRPHAALTCSTSDRRPSSAEPVVPHCVQFLARQSRRNRCVPIRRFPAYPRAGLTIGCAPAASSRPPEVVSKSLLPCKPKPLPGETTSSRTPCGSAGAPFLRPYQVHSGSCSFLAECVALWYSIYSEVILLLRFFFFYSSLRFSSYFSHLEL